MNLQASIPAVACVLALASGALALPSNVSPSNKLAYTENCGVINFRDAGSPITTQGVRLSDTFLSGFAWSENLGWICLGMNPPVNGATYANPTEGSVAGSPEFGVNRDPVTNALSGFAWSETAGWINFSGGALALPANPARYDPAAHRLRGYAWGENIGWLNLDSATMPVSFCAADFDGNGLVNLDDIFIYLNAWFQNDLRCDIDSGGTTNLDDMFIFLNAWFAGC